MLNFLKQCIHISLIISFVVASFPPALAHDEENDEEKALISRNPTPPGAYAQFPEVRPYEGQAACYVRPTWNYMKQRTIEQYPFESALFVQTPKRRDGGAWTSITLTMRDLEEKFWKPVSNWVIPFKLVGGSTALTIPFVLTPLWTRVNNGFLGISNDGPEIYATLGILLLTTAPPFMREMWEGGGEVGEMVLGQQRFRGSTKIDSDTGQRKEDSRIHLNQQNWWEFAARKGLLLTSAGNALILPGAFLVVESDYLAYGASFALPAFFAVWRLYYSLGRKGIARAFQKYVYRANQQIETQRDVLRRLLLEMRKHISKNRKRTTANVHGSGPVNIVSTLFYLIRGRMAEIAEQKAAAPREKKRLIAQIVTDVQEAGVPERANAGDPVNLSSIFSSLLAFYKECGGSKSKEYSTLMNLGKLISYKNRLVGGEELSDGERREMYGLLAQYGLPNPEQYILASERVQLEERKEHCKLATFRRRQELVQQLLGRKTGAVLDDVKINRLKRELGIDKRLSADEVIQRHTLSETEQSEMAQLEEQFSGVHYRFMDDAFNFNARAGHLAYSDQWGIKQRLEQALDAKFTAETLQTWLMALRSDEKKMRKLVKSMVSKMEKEGASFGEILERLRFVLWHIRKGRADGGDPADYEEDLSPWSNECFPVVFSALFAKPQNRERRKQAAQTPALPPANSPEGQFEGESAGIEMEEVEDAKVRELRQLLAEKVQEILRLKEQNRTLRQQADDAGDATENLDEMSRDLRDLSKAGSFWREATSPISWFLLGGRYPAKQALFSYVFPQLFDVGLNALSSGLSFLGSFLGWGFLSSAASAVESIPSEYVTGTAHVVAFAVATTKTLTEYHPLKEFWLRGRSLLSTDEGLWAVRKALSGYAAIYAIGLALIELSLGYSAFSSVGLALVPVIVLLAFNFLADYAIYFDWVHTKAQNTFTGLMTLSPMKRVNALSIQRIFVQSCMDRAEQFLFDADAITIETIYRHMILSTKEKAE